MPAAHQVHARLLACASEIAGRLERRRRDHDRRERPGHQLPQQQIGIATIGLVPIPRRSWRLGRRDHLTIDPRRHRRPIQAKPGRARLVTGTHRPRQPSQPRDHRRHRARVESLTGELAGDHIHRRRVGRARVDIHRGPCHRSGHGRTSFVWGQPEPLSGQSNPRTMRSRSGPQRLRESSSIASSLTGRRAIPRYIQPPCRRGRRRRGARPNAQLLDQAIGLVVAQG